MTEAKIASLYPIVKLIPQIPDTDLSRLIAEGLALGQNNPNILTAIDQNRDAIALQKKRVRIEDSEWMNTHGKQPLDFGAFESSNWSDRLQLDIGRERMPAIMVLIFILIRGYFGGFKDRKTATSLAESRTLEILLTNFGIRMPGASTILDNVNPVTPATLELIVDAQIKQVIFEGLDDFKNLVFDNTACAGNSAWPTDSGTIMGLSFRGEHLLRSLGKQGIRSDCLPSFQICWRR